MNSIRKTIRFASKLRSISHELRFSSSLSNKRDTEEETCTSRLLRISIIGMPNAGKSTLINSLMDRKVCPASSKVHTTKKKSVAIFTECDAQIVFLDTPGIVSSQELKKYNLNKSFFKDSNSSLHQADLIGVVHDVSNTWTYDRIDIKVLNLLEHFKNKPSILILNKVDLLKNKRKLLELTRKLTENRLEGKLSSEHIEIEEDEVKVVRGWPFFKEIFMLSSLTGNGVGELRNYLVDNAIPSPWMFPAEQFSGDKYEDIIVNSVRSKLLDFLPQEIPYSLETKLELLETDENGRITTVVIVKCPSARVAKLIAGTYDGRLKQIVAKCQEDLQDAFRCFVRIKIVLHNEKEKN
ncbi:hypothetical protein WA026_015358 [Henosepilachna vigintioctopunctata]|uniref:GTPase Era, mitochondrial n=1 Tax=Henosepilachna vigintioctopunctata TaxID=420089 RepID=A0AAW1UMK7_9CUCU